MANPKGFLSTDRQTPSLRDPKARIGDFDTHPVPFNAEKLKNQAGRCMDCGIPFCMSGCPLRNQIPDFNDLNWQGNWEEALRTLHATNNFPEFTGLICPAPCESSCTLGINQPPVAIKLSEQTIIEKGWKEGLIRPVLPTRRTGKKVAIVGSGPAGLAAAQQLCRAGHEVTVYEKAPKAGGLLTWGIPAYKLPKDQVERRVRQLEKEGVSFRFGVNVGPDISFRELRESSDALVIAIGAEKPRDLPVQGRDAGGIHFAMDFLPQQSAKILDVPRWNYPEEISAAGKDVVVIGGGDTGSDCIGTSLRQGARSVTNLELMSKAPDGRSGDNPWPQYARVYRVSSSMEENFAAGGSTEYDTATKSFTKDENGQVTSLETIRVRWEKGDDGRMNMVEVPGTEQSIPCQLVLLAMGYVSPVTEKLVEEFDLELDGRGNIRTDDRTKGTSYPGVFAAGDCRRGQSLVVWAIAEGRDTAAAVDSFLQDRPSVLPRVRSQPYDY